MSGRKYHGAADPIDGTRLVWNVHPDGVPVRAGDAPKLIDQHQLAAATTNKFFRSEFFRLPDDNERYVKVMDWLVNVGVAWYKMDQHPLKDDAGRWTVWVQWVELRGVIPDKPAY